MRPGPGRPPVAAGAARVVVWRGGKSCAHECDAGLERAVAIDTACSSSLVGAHIGRVAIIRAEADACIACGVNLMMRPVTMLAMCKLLALSPEGRCRTFDAAAGMVRLPGEVRHWPGLSTQAQNPSMQIASHIKPIRPGGGRSQVDNGAITRRE